MRTEGKTERKEIKDNADRRKDRKKRNQGYKRNKLG